MSSNDKLRNVGPKSAAWLRQVGIRTQGDLVAAGAVDAFIKVKRAGFRPSLNLLYALEGALLGCHWQQVPEARRGELLQAAEAASALLPLPKNKRLAIGGEVRDVTPPGASRRDDDGLGEGGGHGGGGGMESSFGFDDPAGDDERGERDVGGDERGDAGGDEHG